MAETSIPGLSQSSSIVLHNGKAALPIKAGQANVFKAKAGEHYRVLKGKEGEEQLVDNVVAKHAGADLKLEYTDGTQVTLENYYVECKAGDCDVTVPGKTGEGYKISSGSTGGAALGDGSTLVYAHGSPEALMGMAQGNAPMQAALGGLKGTDITYLPSALEIGSTNLALLGGGGLVLAAAGGGGGGGGSALAAAVHNLVGGGVVAGPVVAGNGLTVNLFQADGVTLLGTQKLSDTGTFSIDVGSYTGAVIGKLVDAGAGNDFIDEATGQARDMNANLMAIGVAGSGTTTVNMNALTTIAALKAGAIFAGASAGLITSAVIVQTNAAVASAFGLTDLIGSSVVTTVDTTGSANAAFTPAALTAAAKYGAALAALSGMDAANGGDMQATITSLVAGITIAGSTATLSNATVDAVVLGATTASANTGGTGANSLTAIISTLTAQTSASVSINQIATDGVISAIEQSSTISGTTVAGATVNLTLGGNVRAAAVVGTTWSYDLTGADIAAVGQGGEIITATATLTGGGTATATRSAVVDTVGPSVTNVAITSATGIQNSTMNAGDVVSVTVTMSEGTTVTGTPQLSLNIGGTTVLANYASGSGTPYIVFTYTVLASQTDLNGVAIGANSLALNGGTLVDAAGNTATVTHAAIADNAGYLVDNTAPTLATTTYSAAENATAVATLAGTDAGAITYSLGGTGADNALFSISSGGALTFLAAKNFEAAGSAAGTNAYAITVNLTDAAGNVTNQAVTVNVTNVNEAPVMNSATTASFAENGTGTVYTAAATDVDAGTTLSYTIGGTDSALFNINASTGAVTFKAVPNYEAPTDAGANNVYDITVTASDGSLTATQAVAITVTNLNDNAPVFTSGGTGTVAENAATSTVIYTAATTDADNLAARTYTVSGTDAGLVDITSAGVVTLKASADYESKTSYSFNVIANDGANTTTQAVVVSVTNLNDNAPPLTSPSVTTVAYNAPSRTVIYTAATTDADNLAVRTYTVSGTDAGLVDITSAGVVTLKASADYESKTSYSFNVIANDGANTTTQAVVVSVTNLNDNAPVFTSGGTGTVAENAATSTVIYTAATTDADNLAARTYTVSGTDAGLVDITSAGVVTLKASADYESKTSYSFNVIANDGANTTTQAVVVSVTNVYEAPTITSAAAVTFSENGTGAAYSTAATADSTKTLTYSLSGTDSLLFNINASTGAVTFNAVPDFEAPSDSGANNVYDITVTASDGSLTATQVVAITVTNLNDNAPVFTSGGTGTVAENAATSTVIYTAATTDADNLAVRTYTVSGTDAGLVDITSAGVVTLKASADYESKTSYSFNVIANDGANTTTQAVVVSVTNVNEAPIFTSAATASFAENGTGTAYTATATDVDAGTTLTYTLGGTDAAKFAINSGTGVVTFVTAPNYEAPTDSGANNVYDITVTATDNGSGSLSATKAVAITVTNVNEAPVFTSAATASFVENGTGTAYTATATDVDADTTLTYTLGGTDAAKFAINAGTGVVTFVTAPNYEAPTDSGANNVYDITVTATDNGSGSLSATKAVAITVTNVVDSLEFNLTYTAGTTADVQAVFLAAANFWSSILTDSITVNLNVGLADLADGILGGAASQRISGTYAAVRAALIADASSANDNLAVASLASGASFGMLLNRTSNNPNGASSANAYTDNDADANNQTIWGTRANAKAAGLLSASADSDATITFSSASATAGEFDYDRSDGIAAGKYDFLGIAIHEIGHALGFTSGVDNLALNPGQVDSYYTFVSPLDLFRYSTASTALGIIDWTASTTDKYFSLKKGTTKIASFSTGTAYGDGQQSSHWKDSLGLGSLDPTAGLGELMNITNLDLIAFDVMGWNLTAGLTNAATPRITSLSTVSFAENGTNTVYTAVATDADAGGSLTFAVGGTDGALFNINAATGVVSFKTAPDYEAPTDAGANNVYDITVTANDGVHTSAAQAVAITVTDMPLTTLALGTVSGVNLNLINRTTSGGKYYYYLDHSADGTSSGADYITHTLLDNLLNGGSDTVDTQTTGAVKGVNDARTVIVGGYTLVLPTATELLALYSDTAVSNLPANWVDDYYWSSTQYSSNTHDYVHLKTDVRSSGGADSLTGYVAFQVL